MEGPPIELVGRGGAAPTHGRRPLVALILAGSLALCLGACGQATEHGVGSTRTRASSNVSNGVGSATLETTAMRRFRGDEDDDETKIGHGSEKRDRDGDFDRDAPQVTYLDADDGKVREFGRAASPSEAHAIALVVARYERATATANGRAACALIFSLFAEAIPEDYGRNMGPRYARGTTCPGVLSKIFAHEHRRFGVVFAVTAVRVSGKRALAMLGSTAAPASYFALQREGTAWKIDTPFVQPLP